jgi:hypothetical protein
MIVNVLYAVDCNEYKVQYNKYINKAKANKSLSKRYNLVAERFNIMFLNCETSNKHSVSQQRLLLSTFNDESSCNSTETKQSPNTSPASSYRTNPFNTK